MTFGGTARERGDPALLRDDEVGVGQAAFLSVALTLRLNDIGTSGPDAGAADVFTVAVPVRITHPEVRVPGQ